MAKKTNEIPAEKLDLYQRFIDTHPDVERKGKTTPYTSVNGHMFSFLTKEGAMGLRLPADERDRFIAKFDSKLMEQHGRIMKEYVVVPDALFENTEEVSVYLQHSYTYVVGLKPKPTKKKK